MTNAELDVGAILVNTWGWEQTNVDFYEVVKRTEKSVTIRKIAREIDDYNAYEMSGFATPKKGEYIEDAIRKTVVGAGVDCHIKFKHGGCSLWDGAPKRYTTYA
jgi:hypothetical protein